MHSIVPAALSAALVGALPVASPTAPAARAEAPTTCTARYDVVVTPGLGNSPTRGTIHTARPGTIRCDGPVLGRRPTGAGRIVVIARLEGKPGSAGASCLDGGGGPLTIQVSLPTDNGELELFEAAEYTFGGLANGLVRGTVAGDHLDGSYTAIPTKGDCVTKPTTSARVDLTAKVHPYRVGG
jgi:hypothetical protein